MNDVGKWLGDLGLRQYAEAFAAQDIDGSVLSELTDADLEKLGVGSLGHRKRLLKAIAALQANSADPRLAATSTQPEGVAASSAPSSAAVSPSTAGQTAERRQLTVMFCDLVGSTALSGQLDPEDLQQVIGGYHSAVAGVVAPYEGHVAQFLGDGVLVYFGYPRAHEDDPIRAVRAALEVIKTVEKLRPHGDTELQTRIGIATGPVVVGQIGAGTPAAEQSATGETPNLAARLQGQAQPGEIVLSDETRKLVGAAFELQSLGKLDLKGIALPVGAWRITGESRAASRFEAQHSQGLTGFVGRDSEVSMLLERWAMARDGEGQVVLLSGEAGIGKSRIMQTLRERLHAEPNTTVLLQGSPYFANSALYPVAQALERMAGVVAADSSDLRIAKLEQGLGRQCVVLEPESFGQVLRVLGLPDGGRVAAGQTPQQGKALTLSALIELLLGLAKTKPVLFLIEDAHWIDPTTEELLTLALDRLREASVLIMVTCRPEYVPSWGNPSHLTKLTLNRLGHKQCAALIQAVTGGKSVPAEVLAEIVRKTDGIPLFVEELTKTVVESGLLHETAAGYELKGPLPALAIPSSLKDSLMARLDRLAPAKEVAQLGAAIGREFSHRLLVAIMSAAADGLNEALDELVRAELVFRRGAAPDAIYTFKHALVRDTAYNSMVRSQRVLCHRQIAAAIEQTEPETAAAHPELLAHHHQEAGEARRAWPLWVRAGDAAAAKGANSEAAKHYFAALALLGSPGESIGSDDDRLAILSKRGEALMNSDGFAATSTLACMNETTQVAERLGRLDDHVAALVVAGPATMYAKGRFRAAVEVMEGFTASQVASLLPRNRVRYLCFLGIACFLLGDLERSWAMLDETRRLDDLDPSTSAYAIGGAVPAMVIRAYLARNRAIAGDIPRVLSLVEDMQVLAAREKHPPTVAWAMQMNAWAALLAGRPNEGERYASEAIEFGQRFGLRTRVGNARVSLGRAQILLHDVEGGIQNARDGLLLWRETGGLFHCSEYAALIASSLVEVGRSDAALEFIEYGEKVQAECDERFFVPELKRLRGCWLESQGDFAGARAAFDAALTGARAMGAGMFEASALRDLARLSITNGSSQSPVA